MKKTLLNENDKNEILGRLDRLTSGAQRQWGKMEVDQMLTHCALGLEMALGDYKPKPAPFPMRIIGHLIRKVYTSGKPFKKNSPTDKSFVVRGHKNFDAEKSRLTILVSRFYTEGGTSTTKNYHPIFGYFTQPEWAIGSYKHLDHHLRQFGC